MKKKRKRKYGDLINIRVWLTVVCVMLMLSLGVILWVFYFGGISPTEHGNGITDTTPTDTEPVTEAVTEAPVPYYTREDDLAYLPTAHTDDVYPVKEFVSDEYRIYCVSPETDNTAFNGYTERCITSLMTAYSTKDYARLGGTRIAAVDYSFMTYERVYCVLFTVTVYEGEGIVSRTVQALPYDTEAESVYSALDIYDASTDYMNVLALAMRDGFTSAFAELGTEADTAFLDAECAPEPSSFHDMMTDGVNYYFPRVAQINGVPTVVTATVPRNLLTEYETAYLEEQKRLAEEAEREAAEQAAAEKEAAEKAAAEQAAAIQQSDRFPAPEGTVTPVYTFDAGGAVPKSDAVDNSYFDDALFIGNSLVVGFSRASKLTNATYLASIGMNVSQFFNKACITMTDGSAKTPSEALEYVTFSKVYLLFGVNELGWGSIASFIRYYGDIVDRIREVNPEAVIYVQSILPINEEKWAQSGDYQSCISNEAVVKFNQQIIDMCAEKQVAFVNVWEAFTVPDTGNMDPDVTGDGIHITGAAMPTWVEYLKTHTVPVKES